MARFKILRWTVLGTVLLGLTACKKNDDPTPGPNDTKRRTVLTYMVADNNLYSFAERDINEMEAGWSTRFDGRLVVFLYPVAKTSGYAPRRTDYDEDPRLLLIERDDRTDVISSRVLKRYDRTMDPTDPATMRRVIDEVMQLAPAESYGLVLWSHGSGWLTQGLSRPLRGVASPLLSVADEPGAALPSETTAPEDGVTAYSFGASDSHGGEMEVDELARALPTETTFDFILFDACHMAGIEVAWELRERTEYVIASAAETLANGFPYEAILGPMFEATADVKMIAREFYDYYNGQSGSFQSATVGVIRCNRLPEVAAAMRSLCESGLPAGGISYAGQQYGRKALDFDNTFYDLSDFVRRTWGTVNTAGVARFDTAMDKAIIYQAATPWLFKDERGAIRILTHCGVSCYLPRASQPQAMKAYRSRLGWSAASGMGSLVP